MRFYVKFNTPNLCNCKVEFNTLSQNFDLKIKNLQQLTNAINDIYQGNYEVTPKVTQQILSTKNKVMTDNLKIKEIPYFETNNNSGGNTVYIGKEI